MKISFGAIRHPSPIAIEAGLSMAGPSSSGPYYFVRYGGIGERTPPPKASGGAVLQALDGGRFPSTAEVSAFLERHYALLVRHAATGL
ncbi:MAG: hypothetical protein QM786_15375 [Breznakibacter sp.]